MKNISLSISAGLLLTISQNVFADTCDNVLVALNQERHLFLVKQGDDKQTTQYRDGPKVELSLTCAVGAPNLAVTWDGLAPDQEFYDLLGRTGSLISKHPVADIVRASQQCRAQALKDVSEIATVEQNGLAIECHAFTRDGGATIISVFAE